MKIRVQKSIVILFILISATAVLIGSAMVVSDWLLLFINIPALVLMLIMFHAYFGCYYRLSEDQFVAYFGLFKTRIPYDQIKKISISDSLLAAHALTFTRLAIVADKEYLFSLIHPDDQEAFIKFMKEKCPNAEIDL